MKRRRNNFFSSFKAMISWPDLPGEKPQHFGGRRVSTDYEAFSVTEYHLVKLEESR